MELVQFSIKTKKICFFINTHLKSNFKHRTLTKIFSSLNVGLRHLRIFMPYQMIADGKFEEFEKLVRSGEASLEDLSEEMFQKFKEWIEG